MPSESTPIEPEWAQLPVTPRGTGVRFAVHVRPRASRTAILGVREGAIAVALTAPPADGAANNALITLFARALGLPKASVAVVVGATNRSKIMEVVGIDAGEVRERLAGAVPRSKG